MTTRYATIGVFGLSFLISATSPFVETARAQMPLSCNQEIARQEAALDQFAIDARRESIDFVLDDARRSALSGVRARLAGNRTSDALEGIRQRWEDWNGFIERGRTLQAIMAQISQCLAAGAGDCLNELIERNRESARLLDRVAEATNAYIESLGNETISNAAARVERARGVLQNLTTRAGNLATGALRGAMQNCFGDFEREVEAGGDPVDTASVQPQPQPQPPTQPPAPPVDLGGDSGDEPAEGGGGGNPIVPIAVAGGAGVGGWIDTGPVRSVRQPRRLRLGRFLHIHPQLCCEFLQWRLQLFGDDQRTVRLQWHTRRGRRELRQQFAVQERTAVHQRSV